MMVGLCLDNGCTMPAWVHRILKANRWDSNACRLHDFHREFKIVPRRTADNILRNQIRDHIHTPRYYIFSWMVWLAVRLARKQYKETHKLPDKWHKFMYQQYGGYNVV
jgi:hypothetical protein